MGDVCFNIAKGYASYYGGLPAASDSLIAVPIEASGIVSDATMVDYDTLDAILAGASNEQTGMGRVTLTGVSVTVDTANDRVDIDADDITWTSPSAGNAIAAVVICYVPSSGAADSAIVPISKHDVAFTPNGTASLTVVLPSGGFYRTA